MRKGVLDFENRRKKYRTSIVGLYGQNGSGKTALIDAIQLLKYSLCGKSAPNKYADYINVEKAFSTLKFQFKMQKAEEIYNIWYQFSIKKVLDYSDIEGDTPAESEVRYKVQIIDEVLSFAYLSDKEKIRKSALIDTRTAEVFVPKAKYNELLKNIDEDLMEMFLTKRLAQEQSRSFIFSREMMNRFRKSCEIEIYLNILISRIERNSLAPQIETLIILFQKTGDTIYLHICHHCSNSTRIIRQMFIRSKYRNPFISSIKNFSRTSFQIRIRHK